MLCLPCKPLSSTYIAINPARGPTNLQLLAWIYLYLVVDREKLTARYFLGKLLFVDCFLHNLLCAWACSLCSSQSLDYLYLSTLPLSCIPLQALGFVKLSFYYNVTGISVTQEYASTSIP